MTAWIETLAPESNYMVPLYGLLFFTTDGGAQINWRHEHSYTGPDNIVPPGQTDFLALNAFTRTYRIKIAVSGGIASYKLLSEDDAFNYRVANNLPHGRGPESLIYGG